MYFNGTPGFAFGHGLSYTNFQYSNLTVSQTRLEEKARTTVKIDVRNNGKREGEEVLQLYVHELASDLPRPKKQLAVFERIHLRPGEKKTVTLTLQGEQLAFWDTERHKFAVTQARTTFWSEALLTISGKQLRSRLPGKSSTSSNSLDTLLGRVYDF